MIAQTAETGSWSRRRLLAITLVLMLGQLGFLIWLSRGTPPPRSPKIAPLTYVSSRNIGVTPGIENPASFVLPNPAGFSGSAWLNMPALDYDPPVWTDRAVTSKQTAFVPEGSLTDFLRSKTVAPAEFATTHEAPSGGPLPLDNILDTPSFISIEGGLAGWPLTSKPRLGEIRVNDILKNSVVLAGVTPQGEVFSAVLLEKSGSAAADARAVAAARSLRFATPMSNFVIANDENPSQLRWGRLIFHWQTVAVSPTNSVLPP